MIAGINLADACSEDADGAASAFNRAPMRGRVNAVDMLFIGVSNELGEFESGVTAQWFGTVPAVVLGGVGTLLVIAAWAWLFPELRNANRLTPVQEEAAEAASNGQRV